MSQITIGPFVRETRAPLSAVALTAPALDFVAHWRRCGITADWLAAFAAYDFESRRVATSVLSTVVNELLENAAKFSADKHRPVELSLRHYGDQVRIETHNQAEARHVRLLQDLLAELAREQPEAVFTRKLERRDDADASGLGLVILVKDYAAGIAAALEAVPGEPGAEPLWQVSIQVSLAADVIEDMDEGVTA